MSPRLLLPVVMLLGCSAPGGGEPLEPAALAVATWNVRRLFDAVCDSGRCGEGEPEPVPAEAVVDGDVARVSRAVRGLDADVVVLVEVEHRALLERVVAGAGGARTLLMAESGPGTIDVGLLSRWPLLRWAQHRPTLELPGRRAPVTRAFLEAHLDAAGRRWIVLGAHLKSKAFDDPPRREAEAAALARLAEQRRRAYPEALLSVVGDLNDEPDSAPLTLLEDAGLELLTRRLPPAEAYTFRSGGRRSLLDHVLWAPLRGARVTEVRVRRQAGGVYGGSDHAALRVELSLD